MKKFKIVLIILLLLTMFTACDFVQPNTNTPTPPPVSDVTPEPATAIPTPTLEVTSTPAPTEVTDDNILNIYPVYVQASKYISNTSDRSTYKQGDGFRDAVDVVSISCSSTLSPQAGNTYNAENLYDFNLNTVWCEGKDDEGIGEWVMYKIKAFDYAPNAKITKLEIINGYIKNNSVFQNNSMAKTMLVTVDGRKWCLLNFNVSKQIQQFDIPDIELSTTESVEIKFELVEVYGGDKYADTCITAIEFDGTGIY